MNYRKQIENKLTEANWNIASINANKHWWDDEHWKIQYKYNHQLTFYICFIVDPQFEGVRKKGQGVDNIKALGSFPNDWNDETDLIASIYMGKRKFNLKFKEFFLDLEQFKHK